MSGSHFIQLVVFAGIHHLAHQVVTSGFAKDSGCPIERPARSELCHHTGVDKDMRDGKWRLMPDWCFVVSGPDDDKEDIGCLTKLVQRCFRFPAFLQLLQIAISIPGWW